MLSKRSAKTSHNQPIRVTTTHNLRSVDKPLCLTGPLEINDKQNQNFVRYSRHRITVSGHLTVPLVCGDSRIKTLSDASVGRSPECPLETWLTGLISDLYFCLFPAFRVDNKSGVHCLLRSVVVKVQARTHNNAFPNVLDVGSHLNHRRSPKSMASNITFGDVVVHKYFSTQ